MELVPCASNVPRTPKLPCATNTAITCEGKTLAWYDLKRVLVDAMGVSMDVLHAPLGLLAYLVFT